MSDVSSPHGRPPDDAHKPPDPNPETRPVSEEGNGLVEDGETAGLGAMSTERMRETRPESSKTAAQGTVQSHEIRPGPEKPSEQTERPCSGLGSSTSMTSRKSKEPAELRSHS